MTAPAHVLPMGAPPITPEPGVYAHVQMEQYHAWNAASNSRLSQLLRSPAHLKAYIESPKADTKSTRIGRAAHTSILEPELFDTTFTVAGKCTAITEKKAPCSNDGLAFHLGEGWLCGTHRKKYPITDFDDSRCVITPADVARCIGMRRSVLAHPAASGLLQASSEVELSMLWKDPRTGLPCKGRMDVRSPGIANGAIVDIKTTDDARKDPFERKILTYGYHRQAAMYLDGAAALGIQAKHYIFIAVEKEPPYAVAVWRLSEGAVDEGRIETNNALIRYANCVAKNDWPAYHTTVEDIHLPPYGYKNLEALDEVAA